MIGEVLKDISAVKELLRHPLSASRDVNTVDYDLSFSTPGIMSRWELSFVKNTESHVYEKMLSEMDEEDVFYDIGANLGFYSCLISQKASRVYSFEPNPAAVKLLKENLERNSVENAEVMEVALSNEDASKGFKNLFSNSVVGWGSITEEEGEIKARKAETLLENDRVELPDMMKIDVEGHEREVLKGMGKVLEKGSPVIYVESHGRHGKIEEILENYGYEYEKLNRRVEGNVFYRAEPR